MRSELHRFESEEYFGVNGSSLLLEGHSGHWVPIKNSELHCGQFFLNEQLGTWRYVVNESSPELRGLKADGWVYDQLYFDGPASNNVIGRHRLTVMLDQTTPHCMWLGSLPRSASLDNPLDTVFCSGNFSAALDEQMSEGCWTVVECPAVGHFYLNQRGQWHFDCSWQDTPPSDSLVAKVAFSDECGRTQLGGIRFHWVDCGSVAGLKPSVWMDSTGHGFCGNVFCEQQLSVCCTLTRICGKELYYTIDGWSQWVRLEGGMAMFQENGAFVALGDELHVCFEFTDIDEHTEEDMVVLSNESDAVCQHWYDDELESEWAVMTDDVGFADISIGDPFSDDLFDHDDVLGTESEPNSANNGRRFDI